MFQSSLQFIIACCSSNQVPCERKVKQTGPLHIEINLERGLGKKMKAFKIENPSTELGVHVCHTEVSVLNKNKEKERLKDLSYASQRNSTASKRVFWHMKFFQHFLTPPLSKILSKNTEKQGGGGIRTQFGDEKEKSQMNLKIQFKKSFQRETKKGCKKISKYPSRFLFFFFIFKQRNIAINKKRKPRR